MPFFRSCSLLLLSLLAVSPAIAQTSTPSPSAAASAIAKPSSDFLMLQFTYESWAQTPDSVKIGGFGRGFNGYLCYDFPIQKSHFSFAAGLGIGTSNIYFQDQQLRLSDTGAAGQQVHFEKESYDYKKYKLTTAYLEAPFELRYFGNMDNRNRGFKAAIGLRAGLLVGAHVKDSRTVDGTKVVEKINTKRYLDKWRFGATARIGWGNFSLFGSYNLNTLFKDGSGPGVVPYSIGLCLSGL
ncbi:MAG: PorT family protein [Bacteroidetes bacterium]|nr:PorT family protein [Bacteroidota bacterium]MBS1630575.1 PorT family protein [Bacteroidota bacterium]